MKISLHHNTNSKNEYFVLKSNQKVCKEEGLKIRGSGAQAPEKFWRGEVVPPSEFSPKNRFYGNLDLYIQDKIKLNFRF